MPDDPLRRDDADDSDATAETGRPADRWRGSERTQLGGDPWAGQDPGEPGGPGQTAEGPDPETRDLDPAERAAAAVDGDKSADDAEAKSRRSFWKELPALILIALVVAVVIKTFLVQAFFIESGSMRNTLLEGDRVMVNKLSYRFGDIERGDIVVFDPPGPQPQDTESIIGAIFRNIGESIGLSQPASEFIKRVIALEGEIIDIRGNQVFVDGAPLDEPYLRPGVVMNDFGPETVPENHVFVMGDNRSQSRDSTFFGPIPESDIIGRAFVTVWPPSRWSGL